MPFYTAKENLIFSFFFWLIKKIGKRMGIDWICITLAFPGNYRFGGSFRSWKRILERELNLETICLFTLQRKTWYSHSFSDQSERLEKNGNRMDMWLRTYFWEIIDLAEVLEVEKEFYRELNLETICLFTLQRKIWYSHSFSD